MALALRVSAGEQGQTLQQVEVGLAQGLGRVWSQSRLGGVCKLICLYGKYCDKDESFQSLFLVLLRIWKLNTFVEDVFVHLEKNAKDLI